MPDLILCGVLPCDIIEDEGAGVRLCANLDLLVVYNLDNASLVRLLSVGRIGACGANAAAYSNSHLLAFRHLRNRYDSGLVSTRINYQSATELASQTKVDEDDNAP